MLSGTDLAAALVEAMNRKDVGTNELARHFGIKSSSVSEWRTKGKIGKDKIAGLIEYFSDVVGPEHWGLPHLSATAGFDAVGTDPSEKYLFATRVYGAVLSAGNGSTHWEHEEIEGSHAFTRAWLQRKRLKIDKCRVLTVDGDSMLPELRNGFVVLIDLSDCDPIKSGKVYALSVDGEQRIKRLFPQIDGSLKICSDNPDKAHFPDEVVQPEHLERVRIIGRKRWHAGDDD
jgi:hypothetical protein